MKIKMTCGLSVEQERCTKSQSLVYLLEFLLSDRVPEPGLQKNEIVAVFLELDGELIGSEIFSHVSHGRAFLDHRLVGCIPHEKAAHRFNESPLAFSESERTVSIWV
jgi:hypothetical protein